MEAFGIIASTAQLADAGIKIASGLTEIRRRVCDSPKELEPYVNIIQELIETARYIRSNCQLHTYPELVAHLNTALVEAESLKDIVQLTVVDYSQESIVRRCWKAAPGSKERKILQGLQRLEQEKSSLILCLSSIYGRQVWSIQFGIDTLAAEMSSEKTKASKNAHRLRDPGLGCGLPPDMSDAPHGRRESQAIAVARRRNGDPLSSIVIGQPNHTSAISRRGTQKSTSEQTMQREESQAANALRVVTGSGSAGTVRSENTYHKITIGETNEDVASPMAINGPAGDADKVPPTKSEYKEIKVVGSAFVISAPVDGRVVEAMLKNWREAQQQKTVK